MIEKMQKIDICVVGDVSVGKSSLIASLKKQKNSIPPTIGVEVDFYKYGTYKLCFWDTSGQSDFRDFIGSYYKKANVIVVVVSIKDIRRAQYWYDTVMSIVPDTPIILCINKIDLYVNKIVHVPVFVKNIPFAHIFLTSMYIREKTLTQCLDTLITYAPVHPPVSISKPKVEESINCCTII